MKQEYNDYQILSPSIMEKIAREYNLLNNSNNLEMLDLLEDQSNKEIFDLEEYKYIISNFETVFSNLTFLKKYCSKSFYHKKELQINSILNKIEDLFKLLNFTPDNKEVTKYNNYCELITHSINIAINTIYKSMELFIKSTNKSFAHQIHSESLKIISEIVNLIGICKYRSLF